MKKEKQVGIKKTAAAAMFHFMSTTSKKKNKNKNERKIVFIFRQVQSILRISITSHFHIYSFFILPFCASYFLLSYCCILWNILWISSLLVPCLAFPWKWKWIKKMMKKYFELRFYLFEVVVRMLGMLDVDCLFVQQAGFYFLRLGFEILEECQVMEWPVSNKLRFQSKVWEKSWKFDIFWTN